MTMLTFEFSVFASAILLALSFPKFNLWWLAYIALVPALLGVKRSRSYRESAILFLLVGFVFALVSMEWIRHVTYFGWVYVCLVGVGCYFAVFGALAHFALHRKSFNAAFLILPAGWTLIEWFRSELPVWAMGWNLLGYSQSEFLPVARLASVVGVYGVSFFIIFVNVSIWFALECYSARAHFWRAVRKLFYASFAFLIIALHFSQVRAPEASRQIAVSVIQGNIPQTEKWDPEFKAQIIETYRKLTELAAASEPDLIVWPEAAWPGILNREPEQKQILDIVKAAKSHLLIGSPFEEDIRNVILNEVKDQANSDPSAYGLRMTSRIYNSAHLLDSEGKFLKRYDKIRLVPFGEFVPFAQLFNLFGLERFAYSLGVGDFSAGKEFKVFELKNAARFSTLICFEDTFPSLARKFARNGAEFLTVITNDAWFGKSAAAYQHLQASQFRAIENGIPIIRAANTGVSAFIDAGGEVFDRVRDAKGHDTWIAGGLTRQISLAPAHTFYSRLGHWFPVACLALTLSLGWFTFTCSRRT